MENKTAQAGYFSWLIPVLSLLVIFQAVVLVRQMGKSKSAVAPYIQVPAPEGAEEASVSLSFVPSGVAIKEGETTDVDLIITPKKALRLDGADIVVSFDPEVLQVLKVSTSKLFSLVSQNRESEKVGRVYVTFLEEAAGGILIDKEVKFLTLTIKGKETGEGMIEILSAKQGATTVITENGTSKKILFDKGNLKVVVY